jgi:Tfp pilus assembly protein PilZ/ActR/RegA family two-component response regulator
MPVEHSLAVVGAFRETALRCVDEAAASVGIRTLAISRCEDAAAALTGGADLLAILVRMDNEGACGAFAHVRGHAALEHLPIFGVAPRRDDVAFTELFSWGGDDLLALASPVSLERRLRSLVACRPSAREPKTRKHSAVVGGADARWRSVMGRALYHGGFAVRFAAVVAELTQESLTEDVRVVVIADDLGAGEAEAVIRASRARGSQAAWIVVTPPKRLASVREAIESLESTSVADSFAPPENVLFLTNELLSKRALEQRASPRILYGSTVAFRPAGRDEDELGFSYNVNAGGVYVRTLAPLAVGQEVWMEMWPPRSDRRVRLAGAIAWKRLFGPNEGATVPAGFGVRITGGLPGDLERWRAGYEAFAMSMLGGHSLVRRVDDP